MKTMFHITSDCNLASIMKNGLLPRYGYLSELAMEQSLSAIYLFKSKVDAINAFNGWFGYVVSNFYRKYSLVLLEITLPDTFSIEERFEWECISYNIIPPEYISAVERLL